MTVELVRSNLSGHMYSDAGYGWAELVWYFVTLLLLLCKVTHQKKFKIILRT